MRSSYVATLPTTSLSGEGEFLEIGDLGRWGSFSFDWIPFDRLPPSAGIREALRASGKPLLTSAVALSADGWSVLKVEFFPHFRKRNTLGREAAIVRRLNDAGSATAPRLLRAGVIRRDDIAAALPPSVSASLEVQGRDTFEYAITDFVPTGDAAPLADIILALLEQQRLGVYQADVKPANIRFDEPRGICVLLDYDQAEELPAAVMRMNAADFLEWCDALEKRRYGRRLGSWRRHFKGLSHWRHVRRLLRKGALDLAATTPYRRRAGGRSRSLNAIASPSICFAGAGSMADWIELLDEVEFAPGETVLDFGCNDGALCRYLAARGCKATGADADASILTAARIIANILKLTVDFIPLDPDADELPGRFETVCAFPDGGDGESAAGDRMIARAGSRILVGCLGEESANAAATAARFPGFALDRTVGHADKPGFLMELTKR